MNELVDWNKIIAMSIYIILFIIAFSFNIAHRSLWLLKIFQDILKN